MKVLKVLLCLVLCLGFALPALGEETEALLSRLQVDGIIRLRGETVICDSSSVTLDNRVIRIQGGGSYAITGTGSNFQVSFTASKGETCELVLCSAQWDCDFGPAVTAQADLLTIILVEGTENFLSDSKDRLDREESPSKALVYASDDLTLQGTGSLTLEANLGTALRCRDYLLVDGPTLVIRSANDGLRGSDGVTIRSGSISIIAQGDGIQASNEDSGKGNIYLEGGTVVITAEKDALQAEGTVVYQGGTVTTRCGEDSTKGL